MQKNRPVIEIIKEMFPVSAKVGSLALLWAVIVGVPLGCLAALKRNLGGQLSACAVYHRYLHAGICSGNLTVTYTLWRYRRRKVFPALFDGTPASYVLPCAALGFYPMCYLSRQTRTAMLDSINQNTSRQPEQRD